ncbi:MAG: sugar phosphate isomerase/epimerase [Lentisphaerae bacterium]|jgi:L-ribulose-5-phosphate 3-epimerase|nr:sugar phosphate isomerase/epimerase [Lentisphaerota bacterium]MBT4815345.1 sugar phosphate isomerase/epimerase [Lentisphaerota bacterium]MBT5608892.1 sugar phosphate isomerase/epimerase [Lentisphaerota bacterium]MBT7057396.1 sugar phosphate isomerase/epimerase [Lentisphaerota bacterium]MBT7842758.1 sugar phosphate isomerase/epimerase [Lentisphaerota bacterium]
MGRLKIAVMVNNLRLGVYKGMEAAAEMGVTGVHLGTTVSGFRPEDLDASGRKKLVAHVRSLGLEFSAISAWGGNVDLGETEGLAENIEAGKRFMELAADLECGIWQGHCGIMPHSSDDPRWQIFADSFGSICEHGEEVGACLAIETGPEPPIILKQMIDEVGSPALRVNYDPANLILWPARYMKDAGEPYDRDQAFAEYQPTEGVDVLGPYTVHTHAKDALVRDGSQRQEVPLGDGWVDWPRYVALLEEHGFDGYYAIEREVGDDPVTDIRKAVEFLSTL